MNHLFQRGFTLIELLVVIAIIGLLSAIALASLGTARNKGSDAAIQADLHNIQVQAEIYYYDHANSYGAAGTTCTGAGTGPLFLDTKVAAQISAADNANGTGSISCRNSTTAYAVSAQLLTDNTKYWCVDSNGFAGSRNTAGLSTTQCPGS